MKTEQFVVWTRLAILLVCVGVMVGACQTTEPPAPLMTLQPVDVTTPMQAVQTSLNAMIQRSAPMQASLDKLANSTTKLRKQAFLGFSDEYALYNDCITDLVAQVTSMTNAVNSYLETWGKSVQNINDAAFQLETRKRHEEVAVLLGAMVYAVNNLLVEYTNQTKRITNLQLALDSDQTGPGLKNASRTITTIGVEGTNLIVKASGTIKAINRLAGELLPNGLDWRPIMNPTNLPPPATTPLETKPNLAEQAPQPPPANPGATPSAK